MNVLEYGMEMRLKAEQCFEKALRTGDADFTPIDELLGRPWHLQHTREYATRPPHGFSVGISLRFELIPLYGFALWSNKASEVVKKYNAPILALGSGNAYIEAILEKNGVNIISTDVTPHEWEKNHTIVETLEAKDAITKYPNRAIFCSWTTYDADWLYQAIKDVPKGTLIFYIGEGDGGCVGDDKLHSFFNNQCKMLEWVDIPQWEGIRDFLAVLKRK